MSPTVVDKNIVKAAKKLVTFIGLAQELADQLAPLSRTSKSHNEFGLGLIRKYGFAEEKAGADRFVFVSDAWVLKISRHGISQSLVQETRYIQRMRKIEKFRRHFPMTALFGKSVQVQERLPHNHRLYRKHRQQIWNLSFLFGINDVHSDNVCWRDDVNGPVPVFIDVVDRIKRRTAIQLYRIDPLKRRSFDVPYFTDE